jgi:glutamine synthetase
LKLFQRKKALGFFDSSLEEDLITNISKLAACLLKKLSELESALLESKEERDTVAHARFYREKVFAEMLELRLIVDELETLVARKHWPFPTYGQILYSVI